MDPFWVGATSGSPLVPFGSWASPRLNSSRKAGLVASARLLQTEPGTASKGRAPLEGRDAVPTAAVAPRGQPQPCPPEPSCPPWRQNEREELSLSLSQHCTGVAF